MARTRVVILSLPVLAAIAACGASTNHSSFDDGVPTTHGDDSGVDAGPGGLGGGDSSFNDDGGDAGQALCQATRGTTQKVPVDLYFAVDRSASMIDNGKWLAVTSALGSFLASKDSAGLGAALQFFPLRRACSVDQYTMPAVSFGLLPSIAADLGTAISGQSPETRDYIGTPTSAVLEAAYGTASVQAKANPTHHVAVVLATDGYPELCLAGESPNTFDNVLKLVGAAATGPSKIPTYVIGAGDMLTQLDRIAMAGGQDKAILVDTGQPDLSAKILAAFESIRYAALPCQFTIDPSIQSLDPSLVNVAFHPSNGEVQELAYVAQASDCAHVTGLAWYFDNAVDPKTVFACPDSCTAIKSDLSGEVDLEIGCPTRVAILR